jgi:hypothetical protein
MAEPRPGPPPRRQAPTVPELQSRLASFWLPGQAIVFIGSSQKSVGARLAGMYKTPLGERRPQPTGYWLKTLHDINKARIWWAPVSDPELYEDTLLEAFIKTAGRLPYGVLVRPGGQGRDHGLTAPLHDDEAAARSRSRRSPSCRTRPKKTWLRAASEAAPGHPSPRQEDDAAQGHQASAGHDRPVRYRDAVVIRKSTKTVNTGGAPSRRSISPPTAWLPSTTSWTS